MKRAIIPGLLIGAGIALSPAAQADSVPMLGAHPYQWADGFGTVRPSSFSLMSTASSTVRQITWDSWGGPQATGHGLDANGAGNPDVHVTVIAFDLGTCNGQFVYRQVERTAPGQSFNPSQATNICHG